jgi:hypothetical protein
MRHLLIWRTDGPLALHADAMLDLSRAAYTSSAAQRPAYSTWLHQHGPLPVP